MFLVVLDLEGRQVEAGSSEYDPECWPLSCPGMDLSLTDWNQLISRLGPLVK